MNFSINDIDVGDYVVDKVDGNPHKVIRIEGSTIFIDDGGCLGVDDVADVLLPSEVE